MPPSATALPHPHILPISSSFAPPPCCRYHYLMAFHLFLHKRGQTDHCVRTAENPRATRQFHPLTMNVMEKSKSEGGLGMVKVSLSYCQITTSPCQAFQKDTNLWADYPGILELFVDANGDACYAEILALHRTAPNPTPAES